MPARVPTRGATCHGPSGPRIAAYARLVCASSCCAGSTKESNSLLPCAVRDRLDFTFAENGLVALKGRETLAVQSLKTHLGEAKLRRLIDFALRYIADLDIPVKRGTFIEFRNGMLNVSPIGRNCSQEERDAFEEYDKTALVRCAAALQRTRRARGEGL